MLAAFPAPPTNHNAPPTLVSKAPLSEGAWLWRPRCALFHCSLSTPDRFMASEQLSVTRAAWLLSGWRSARCGKPSSGILVLIDMTTSETGCLLSHRLPDVLYRTEIWWIHVLPQGWVRVRGRSLPSFVISRTWTYFWWHKMVDGDKRSDILRNSSQYLIFSVLLYSTPLFVFQGSGFSVYVTCTSSHLRSE